MNQCLKYVLVVFCAPPLHGVDLSITTKAAARDANEDPADVFRALLDVVAATAGVGAMGPVLSKRRTSRLGYLEIPWFPRRRQLFVPGVGGVGFRPL